MLYILNQKRDISIPIKDDYVIYIRKTADRELYDIIADANPELSGAAKTEYFLGRYFDEKLATTVMTQINTVRGVVGAYYVMPEDMIATDRHICDNPDYCDI